MAYRAPELFDVKTGVPLDEKVDIWVRVFTPYLLTSFDMFYLPVTGLHTFCFSLLAFPVRKHADNGTRRVNSHGRSECTI